MEIVKINPTDFGLTDETAKNIKDQFLPMLNKMEELENRYNEIVQMPIEAVQTQKLAKELRKEYVVVRKATEEIHKKQKAFYLNGGRYVDGWKNAQLFASQTKEDELKRIENYLEELEKQRIAQLCESRLQELRPFVDDITTISLTSLGVMEDDVFMAYLTAKKTAYDERMEAERVAHVQRLAEEHSRKLHDQRKSELIEYWMFMDEEQKGMDFSKLSEKYYNGLLADLKARKSEHEKELQRIREEHEKARKEKEEVEKELMRERIKAEKERKLAEQERERLNAELQKKEAEQREKIRLQQLEEEKALKEAKKLAKAPVKKQLMVWVQNFDIEDMPIHDQVGVDIVVKFEAFKKWAIAQVESL